MREKSIFYPQARSRMYNNFVPLVGLTYISGCVYLNLVFLHNNKSTTQA